MITINLIEHDPRNFGFDDPKAWSLDINDSSERVGYGFLVGTDYDGNTGWQIANSILEFAFDHDDLPRPISAEELLNTQEMGELLAKIGHYEADEAA